MQLSDITVFSNESTIKNNEKGLILSQRKKILNSLATPVGRKFCHTARYSKNRELSEKWLEIRDKWVTVLKRIDPEITADNLPWDNGRNLHPFYNRLFKYNNQLISFFLNQEDTENTVKLAKTAAMNPHNYIIYGVKRSFVYWDAERQDFDLLFTQSNYVFDD